MTFWFSLLRKGIRINVELFKSEKIVIEDRKDREGR